MHQPSHHDRPQALRARRHQGSPVPSPRGRCRPTMAVCEVEASERATTDIYSPRTPPPSPFGACFNSPEHSDVLLRVHTFHTKPSPSSNPPAAHAARSYHGHAVILVVQSGFFKAQLSSAGQQQAGVDGSTSPASVPTRTVDMHVEAEELDALHELLRMLYSQALPAVPPGDPAYLQCLKLADRFDATSCMELLIAGLAAAPIEDLDFTTLNQMSDMFQACPRLRATRSYPALLDSCSKALVRLFGDVPEVIRDEALLQQFCALPHAAVLAWVQSDDLQVHSESCVVFLLSAWVQANQGSTAAQHEQLTQHIRVFHLGAAYLHHILPNLCWFKHCKNAKHLPSVLSCIRAGIKMGQGMEAEKGKVRGRSPAFAQSPGWGAKPRATSSSPMTCAWVLSPTQLKEVSEGNLLGLPSPVCINGFLLVLEVQQSTADPSAAAPGKTLGLYLRVGVAAMAQRGLPLPDGLLVQLGSPRVKAGRPGSERTKEAALFGAALQEAAASWGNKSFLGTAAPTLLELVAPYLDAGRLHVEAVFSGVDA